MTSWGKALFRECYSVFYSFSPVLFHCCGIFFEFLPWLTMTLDGAQQECTITPFNLMAHMFIVSSNYELLFSCLGPMRDLIVGLDTVQVTVPESVCSSAEWCSDAAEKAARETWMNAGATVRSTGSILFTPYTESGYVMQSCSSHRSN